jgi:hypothetical protein
MLTELDATGWELYHVAEDFAENHNVAEENRERLIEMIAQWYVEAGKYNVMPVDGRGPQRFADPRPVIATDRTRFAFYPGTQEVSASAAPRTLNRHHTVTALVVVPEEGAEGVLVSQGGVDGGFSFYVKDGRLHYSYNYVADQYFDIEGDTEVPAGRHALSFEFAPIGEPVVREGKGARLGMSSCSSTAPRLTKEVCRSRSHSNWGSPPEFQWAKTPEPRSRTVMRHLSTSLESWRKSSTTSPGILSSTMRPR